MPPTVVASTSGIKTGSGSSVVIDGSSSLLGGHLRLLFVSVTSDPTIDAGALDSAWSFLFDVGLATSPSDLRRFMCLARIAAGNDGNYTLPFTGTTNYSAAWCGITDWEAAVTGSSYTAAADSGTNISTPDVSTLEPNCLAITYHVRARITAAAPSLPSGMTSIASIAATGSAGHGGRLASEARAATGAIGVKTATATPTSARWAAGAVLITPRAPGEMFPVLAG